MNEAVIVITGKTEVVGGVVVRYSEVYRLEFDGSTKEFLKHICEGESKFALVLIERLTADESDHQERIEDRGRR